MCTECSICPRNYIHNPSKQEFRTHTPTHTHTPLGLARTDEANLEHPNAMTDYSNRTESLRPMTETTAFWGTLGWPSFCRYRWLIRPPLPCLGIASWAQVSKTGLCPLQTAEMKYLIHHVQVCTHTGPGVPRLCSRSRALQPQNYMPTFEKKPSSYTSREASCTHADTTKMGAHGHLQTLAASNLPESRYLNPFSRKPCICSCSNNKRQPWRRLQSEQSDGIGQLRKMKLDL